MKRYNYNGLAGCVKKSTSRFTGTLVGLYHGAQSGMEDDPDSPWLTVCEHHGSLVAHHTLAIARSWLSDPTDWCEECREDLAKKRLSTGTKKEEQR